MNAETKRHIDAARQVLVGVVPNPTSQIDQITNALIYKFMDDMDQAAIKAGGDPSFFIDNLEKYAWTRLMDSKIGNQERMNLYVEALAKFSESKQLPELFRGIFKAAFLPYRSPEVLGLFLKEIDFFDYSHPEELGNAYEYLLSIMSSQGDAGQFRTPRHIIDFIVEVVNPTKGDKVLDPACGTAGFLISAYNHILKQHDGIDFDGKKNSEKPLTPDDRKKLINNFEGYDIDPGMVRIAQVNMYLHQFKNPKIFQYDSLAMDERWNDKFDVILANPPFMSPRGGVQTHNKFSIQSTRSEVLFVDYIMNHLRPKGRAGIIVPEGIIFQSGTAYKQLRKNMIEGGLYAVISLPSGVFQPYSGVKTSILFFDIELAKKANHILFIKIHSDGFDLGAQRKYVAFNDLPLAVDVLKRYQKHVEANGTYSPSGWPEGKYSIDTHPNCQFVSKESISENDDYNISGDRYRITTDYSNTKWPMVKLGDEKYFNIESGGTPDSKNKEYWHGNINWVTLVDLPSSELISNIKSTQRKITESGLKNSSAKLLPINSILISSRATIGRIAVNSIELATNQGFKNIIIKDKNNVLYKYVAYAMSNLIDEMKAMANGGTFAEISKSNFSKLKIPLPPIEVQEQIVEELDRYQNIVLGAKKIIKSWKPIVNIDNSWEIVKLHSLVKNPKSDIVDGPFGSDLKSSEYIDTGVPIIRLQNIQRYNFLDKNIKFISNKKSIELKRHSYIPGDIVMTKLGDPLGEACIIPDNNVPGIIVADIVRIRADKKKVNIAYLEILLNSDLVIQYLRSLTKGATRPRINLNNIRAIEIPTPDLNIQQEIVIEINNQKVLIDSVKQLMNLYEQKIKDKIDEIWND